MFEILLQEFRDRRSASLVTLIAGPQDLGWRVGEQMLVHPDGSVTGCLIDREFTAAVSQTIQNSKWLQPTTLELPQYPGYVLFWDRVKSRQKVLVLGGGHISQPLVEILSLLDYQVTVVDDRLEFANPARFPRAEQVVCQPFMAALDAVSIDDNTAVVIVTRGHRYDLDCLRRVLSTPASYIGMIGSRRKVKTLFEALAEAGYERENLRKVRSPIGLDLNAATPAEIAVSIAAEIIAFYKGGDGQPLALKGGRL